MNSSKDIVSGASQDVVDTIPPAFQEIAGPSVTVVTMKNSSNVEIKPTTQYYAPVTIYQYAPENSEDNNLPSAPVKDSVNNFVPEKFLKPKKHFLRKPKWYFPLGLVTILFVSFIIFIIWRATRHQPSEGSPSEPSSWTEDIEKELEYSGYWYPVYGRKVWGGRAIINATNHNRPLVLPVKYVVVAHTASQLCKSLKTCAPILQATQSAHVAEWSYIDVGYNFLIDGSGHVYQTLGWDIRNYIRNNTITVSFFGNFIYDEVNEHHVNAFQALINRGVERKKIRPDYRLIGHNQAVEILSPGTHMIDAIKKWPHYYNGTYDGRLEE